MAAEVTGRVDATGRQRAGTVVGCGGGRGLGGVQTKAAAKAARSSYRSPHDHVRNRAPWQGRLLRGRSPGLRSRPASEWAPSVMPGLMPRRREPSSTASPGTPAPAGARRRRVGAAVRPGRRSLGRRLRAGAVAGAGALLSLGLLGLIWPPADRDFKGKPQVTAATLGDKPQRPITLLVIGLDSDSLGAPSNGAAPVGPANADAVMLLRVQPKASLQVLNLPIEAAVRVPGQKHPVALGRLYRLGGVALTADAAREITGLPSPAPDRYLVLPRAALRQLINGIGGIDVDPPRTIRYRDKAQKLSIDLQGGLQQLAGQQLEKLLRFRDPVLGDDDRRLTHERVQVALRERLRQSDVLGLLPSLLDSLRGKVATNLSLREALSLLAAALDDRRPIAFARLPLDPPSPGHGKLRQISTDAPNPVWPPTGP